MARTITARSTSESVNDTIDCSGAPPLRSAGRRVVAAEERQRDGDEHGAHHHEDEKEAERRVDEALRRPPGAPAGAGGDGARRGDRRRSRRARPRRRRSRACARSTRPAAARYRPCPMRRTTHAERWPRPTVVGIVNVTPDSFSDGGSYASAEDAAAAAGRMLDEGAAIVDVGGESTRPGADPVDVDEELGRVLPVLERLRGAASRSTPHEPRSRGRRSRSAPSSSTT